MDWSHIIKKLREEGLDKDEIEARIDELLDEYRRQPTDFRLWDHDTLARFAKEVHEELMTRKEK